MKPQKPRMAKRKPMKPRVMHKRPSTKQSTKKPTTVQELDDHATAAMGDTPIP